MSYDKHDLFHTCYTLISNVNIVDIKEGKILTAKTVLLHDNIIIEISDLPTIQIEIPKDYRIRKIDGTGKYLNPGLCDMHVHYNCTNALRLQFLTKGITTIRHVNGGKIQYKEIELLRGNRLIGPNLYTTGANIFANNTTSEPSARWTYYSNSFEGYCKPLNNFNDTNHTFSFDYHREIPKIEYPKGSVFEQWTDFDYLLKSANSDSFWFMSRANDSISPFLNSSDSLQMEENAALAVSYLITKPSQFCIGTESGTLQTRKYPSPPDLHQELMQLKSIGITNAVILQMASMNAGKMVEESSPNLASETNKNAYDQIKFGEVKIGYRADLLLLNANPLVDINNLQKMDAVIVNGAYLDQLDLADMQKAINISTK